MIEYREDDDISYLDLENWINDENKSVINAIIDFSVLVKGIKFMTFKSFQKALKSSGEILVMQMHTYFDLKGHLIPKIIIQDIRNESMKRLIRISRNIMTRWHVSTGVILQEFIFTSFIMAF